MAAREAWFPRRALLAGVAACHALSFASLHSQLPGLVGDDGLLPLRAALGSSRDPALLPFLFVQRGVAPDDPEELAGAVCLCGALVGGALASACATRRNAGGLLTAACFAALHVAMLSLVALGGVFTSFQWDVLLLEATIIAALSALFPAGSALPNWAPRLLLFKLMLMSGTVKLQSGCPTWTELTALFYHFATQPLPTPLAWFADKVEPELLRLGVAGTLAVEGPLSFLLLSPLPTARNVGALLQVVFQIIIASTGNYCFFNLLTAVLACGCMSGSSSHRSFTIRILEHLASLAVLCATAYVAGSAFEVVTASDGGPLLRLSLTSNKATAILGRALPATAAAVLWLALPLTSFISAVGGLRSRRRSGATSAAASAAFLLASCACAIALGCATLSPLAALLPRNSPGAAAFASAVSPRLLSLPPSVASPLKTLADASRLSSGYGLFRAMTGVDPDGNVARPELIIEGRSQSVPNWTEIGFKYKPGGEASRPPSFVAPHQPRLDWQMWFAALNPTPGHSPFVIHLLAKLLEGSGPVYDLLQPRGAFNATHPPEQVQVTLWKYRFTSSAEGGAKIRKAGGTAANVFPVWERRDATPWLAPVSAGSDELRSFLDHNGWTSTLRSGAEGEAEKKEENSMRNTWGGLLRGVLAGGSEARDAAIDAVFAGATLVAVIVSRSGRNGRRMPLRPKPHDD